MKNYKVFKSEFGYGYAIGLDESVLEDGGAGEYYETEQEAQVECDSMNHAADLRSGDDF